MAGTSTSSDVAARLRAWAADHPLACAAIVYALVAAAGAAAAYVGIFSIFNGYDDEGTLLVSLREFVDGDALYRDAYSPYGPFYYELFGGFFALTGFEITTNSSRFLVIAVWLLASTLVGLAAQRLTGRLALGVVATIAAFNVLDVLVLEPMHPHGLCALLLVSFVFFAVYTKQRNVVVFGAVAGALLAALTLTKVNLGLYAVAALVLAAALTAEPLSRRAWIRWPVIAAFLLMPLVVMGRDLNEEWVRQLLALEVLAAGAVIAAAWPLRPGRDARDGYLVDWLIGAATAYVAAFGVILGAILLTGPSIGDVADGVIDEALQVRDTLSIPFTSATVAVDWAIAAFAAALLTSYLRPSGAGRPSPWPGLARIAAGLAIWFTVTQTSPIGLGPAPGNPDALALVLAWVAAVPPVGVVESPHKRFVRVLLPALAVAETLQVYPVAGSQVVIAALIFVPVGALCLADGLTSLRRWAEAGGAPQLRRLGAVAGVLAVALAAKFALDVARMAATNATNYGNQVQLSFAGADRMRLPPEQAAEYERLVALLAERRCTDFIAYPNVNSLYLWSGIEPPVPAPPGAWITALDEAQQRRVVAQLGASERPCAIRNETQAGMWLAGRPRPETPLVRYIFNRFVPVEQVGNFEFMLPRS